MAKGINPPGIAHPNSVVPNAAYANAAWAPKGETLYISGMLATDGSGKIVGKGDIAAQARQALLNIGAVLQAVGGRFDDVAMVKIYVTTLSGLRPIHGVRREFFKPPYPASTLVEVKGLVDPDAMIEIDAVAVIPSGRARKTGARRSRRRG